MDQCSDNSETRGDTDSASTSHRHIEKCTDKSAPIEQDGCEREEIVKLWRQMDEKLEHKAKSHNLSAVNVKTILHHLIKNPGVISLIMGIDDNASLPDLKLTRSKVKKLCKSNEMAESNGTSHETGVIVVPRAERTFLDIDYEHNEDDDEDYNPDLDEADAGSEAEGETEVDDIETNVDDSGTSLQVVEETEADQPALHTRSRYPNAEDEPLCGDDVLLFSAVDDPDYMDFISTLNDPSRYEVDEAEDPEYNFMRDLEYEEIPERDELRMDRATEIPMREVENLLQDLLEYGLTSAPSEVEQTSHAESSKDLRVESTCKRGKHSPSTWKRCGGRQFTEHITVLMGATTDDIAKISLESASLDEISPEKPPNFTAFEIEQLRTQLTKHVQLLTQFMVGCHFEPSLFDVRNEYQQMINELYEYSVSNASNSIFDIQNLAASIMTCHDAITCEPVQFPEINEPRYKKLNLPLPQTMLVLGRSNALIYPELLPLVRLREFPSYYQYFTAPEETLLAMGQYMFSHIPHSTAAKRDGRNTLIVRHFLPNKGVSQIRLHMKNFRLSPEPIYNIIARAEQGMVTMIFPPEKSDSAQSTPPYMWSDFIQPPWLKMLEKQVFYESSKMVSNEITRMDTASPDGVIIRRLPESGSTTPCSSTPVNDKMLESYEDTSDGRDISLMETSSNERQQCTVNITCAQKKWGISGQVGWSTTSRTKDKSTEGSKDRNVVEGRGTFKLKTESMERKAIVRKKKRKLPESSLKRCNKKKSEECLRLNGGGEDCSVAEICTQSDSNGQIHSEAGASEIQTVELQQHEIILKDAELTKANLVTDESSMKELLHGTEMSQRNSVDVRNAVNGIQACSLDEHRAVTVESSDAISAILQVVQTTLPVISTSGSLTSTIQAVDNPHLGIPSSCQVLLVPVVSNVKWIMLTPPLTDGQQTVVNTSTQTAETLELVAETNVNSNKAPSVENKLSAVTPTSNTKDVGEAEQSCRLSVGAVVEKVSVPQVDYGVVAVINDVEQNVTTSKAVQNTSAVEQGCTVSTTDGSLLMQTAHLSKLVDSAADENRFKGSIAEPSGSYLKSLPSNSSDLSELGQSCGLSCPDLACPASPQLEQGIAGVLEGTQITVTTPATLGDMPKVDVDEATKKISSSNTGCSPAVNAQQSSFDSDTTSPAKVHVSSSFSAACASLDESVQKRSFTLDSNGLLAEGAQNTSFTSDSVSLPEGAQNSSFDSTSNSPSKNAVALSKSPTKMEHLLMLEKNCGILSPEDSNSGLTLLFSGSSRAQNLHEETSAPPTPCSFHSLNVGFIDDSASKTRFTDGEGSQAEWRRDGWKPRTPGQPVKAVEGDRSKCEKATKALFTNAQIMASESSPTKIDCGIQWEPLDASSHQPNTSIYDALSNEQRLSESVTQQESDAIAPENMEIVKEVERDSNSAHDSGGHSTEEPRCKKRKRKERLKDGLRGMLNEDHRAKQLRALSRVVLGDFKQRMFMHQHKIRAIQQLISSEPPSEQMFEKLREILGDEHELLLVLVSFLFPEDMLPEGIFNNPMRKAYASAIEMILNIEAYATFGRWKFSARSIFRYIRELGPFCKSEELQARLYEVVGTEHPLWSALSAYLPTAPHSQMHQEYEYEYVDVASWDGADAEWEDVDISCAFKPDAERRRKPAVIANGKLLVEKKGKLCEAIACFKCEEAATIEGRADQGGETGVAGATVKEADADNSEVEIVDVEGCEDVAEKEAVAENDRTEETSEGRRVLGKMTNSEAEDEGENSEKKMAGEKEETMNSDLRKGVNQSNEIKEKEIVDNTGVKVSGSEGMVKEMTANLEKDIVGVQHPNEETKTKESAFSKVSKRKMEKDVVGKKNDKGEMFMEKCRESESEEKSNRKLCKRRQYQDLKANGEKVKVEERRLKNGNCAEEMGTVDKNSIKFLGIFTSSSVEMNPEKRIVEKTSSFVRIPEESCDERCCNAVEGQEIDFTTDDDKRKPVLEMSNIGGEIVWRRKRPAESEDDIVETPRKKVTKGNCVVKLSERHRSEGRDSASGEWCDMDGTNNGRWNSDEKHHVSGNGRRRSEPDLSPIKRQFSGQHSRNSSGSACNRSSSPSYYHPRQHSGRSGSTGPDHSHRESNEERRGVFHRSEHDSRFDRRRGEKNSGQSHEENKLHGEYGGSCKQDAREQSVWKNYWKCKRMETPNRRRDVPRKREERFDHRRYGHDGPQRISCKYSHKVMPSVRLERHNVPSFVRLRAHHEKKPYSRRQWNDRFEDSYQEGKEKGVLIAEKHERLERPFASTRDRRSERKNFRDDNLRKPPFESVQTPSRSDLIDQWERSHNPSKERRYGKLEEGCKEALVKKKGIDSSLRISDTDHGEDRAAVDRQMVDRLTGKTDLEPGELVSDESCDGLENALTVAGRQSESEIFQSVAHGSSSRKMDWKGDINDDCAETTACSSHNAMNNGKNDEPETSFVVEKNLHMKRKKTSKYEGCSNKLLGSSAERPSEEGSLVEGSEASKGENLTEVTTKISEGGSLTAMVTEFSKKFSRSWSREEDEQLLHLYNEFDGDIEKVVYCFAQSVHLNDVQEVSERLLFLLSFFT